MGCDIHVFTERKRTIRNKQKWVNIDRWKIDPYYDADVDKSEYEHIPAYRGRDYNLFAALAGVRNYHDNVVISNPKGLPKDISPHVKKEADSWGGDGHSHSYFTLGELRAAAKDIGPTKHQGWMLPEDAAMVDRGEMPDSWCQGTNIKTYVFREWTAGGTVLDELLQSIDALKKEEFWLRSGDNRPELDDQIRIVFWFDN